MRALLLAIVLGLFLASGAIAAEAQPPRPATPAEITQAIQDHRLVNGMTLKDANRALDAKPRFFTRDGIRTATWQILRNGSVAWTWTAVVDQPSATIWYPKKS